MIDNRPTSLHNLKYYKNIPEEFAIDFESFPEFLRFDMSFLDRKIQPFTNQINEIYEEKLDYKNELIKLYNSNVIKFQLVDFVANIYDFKDINGTLTAVPYALSIISTLKRNKPHLMDPELAFIFENSELPDQRSYFTHFDPFVGSYGLFCSQFTGLVGDNSFTDELGLVIGKYFLATAYDDSGVILPSPYERDDFTQRKFLNHREKKYFKPLLDGKPRKIWGADSPIELFILQGLSSQGVHPEIQTLIFEDGSIYPNYYEMVNENDWVKGRLTKTELDIYFPEEKVAVFCDSSFHRAKKKQKSDENIDKFLFELGIRVLRFDSKKIMSNTNRCIDRIMNEINK